MVIYHHTDRLDAFGVYHPELARVEADVARRARLVISTSEQLQAVMRRHNRNTVCVPNAVEVGHFRRALDDLPEPDDLRPVPRPRAIYVGQVEERIDLDLLRTLAGGAPEVSFVFVGRVAPAVGAAIRSWRCPNVYLLGPRPYATLPAYLKGAAVALIPHRRTELTRCMYPLKLHEYLAAGKPVVSTDLEPLRPFRDAVTLAGTPAAFLEGVRAALTPAGQAAGGAGQRIAAANDWGARAGTVAGLIAAARLG